MSATFDQINLAYSLGKQLGEEVFADITLNTILNFRGYDFLSAREASLLIDELQQAVRLNSENEHEYSEAEIEEMFDLLDC